MVIEFDKFTIGDAIQTGMMLVALAAIIFTGWQTKQQNRLFKAQILKDRFEMYWRNYEPISMELVEELKLYPEEFMAKNLYDSDYKGKDNSIRRYIFQSRTYEYLAFIYTLHKELKVPDLIGEQWSDFWIRDLVISKEFRDAHLAYGKYYPKFKAIVDIYISDI
jgi:hypothetical protein